MPPVIAHSVWEATRTVGDSQRATRLGTAARIEVAVWLRVLRLLLEERTKARHVAFYLAIWSLLRRAEVTDVTDGTSEESRNGRRMNRVR